MRIIVIVTICWLGLAHPAFAQSIFDSEMRSAPGGKVTEVIDGDTVLLSNGDEVRMVGTQAPKLPLGRRGFEKWPLADESRAMLQRLVRGRRFTKYFGQTGMDRHGRVLAHLVSPDRMWLQGEMIRRGMARVYTFPDNTALAAQMLKLEQAARTERLGIWSHPFYAVRSPDRLDRLIGTFQLVQGTVKETATVRGVTYLNFGADWRSDFTISIRRDASRRFDDAPEALEGHIIRVRGWLRSRNGPMIEVTHPEQIETIEK